MAASWRVVLDDGKETHNEQPSSDPVHMRLQQQGAARCLAVIALRVAAASPAERLLIVQAEHQQAEQSHFGSAW
jgi:hypothetical protein